LVSVRANDTRGKKQDDRISSLNGGVGPPVNRLELLTVVILPYFQSHYFVGEHELCVHECLHAVANDIYVHRFRVFPMNEDSEPCERGRTSR
jgi:hypothetical protein